MLHRRAEVSVLISTNKADTSGFAIEFATDEASGTILAVFVNRSRFD
jgi:hypothetical protein